MQYIHSVNFSRHARERKQNRGILRDGFNALIDYGTLYHAGRNCIACHIDRRAIALAKKEGTRIDRYRNYACIIAASGKIVTIEHVNRIPRHWRPMGSKGRVS